MSQETELIKYPRTFHLPSSLGATSDDKYISKETLKFLSSGIELVVTEKLDGGNFTMTRNHAFARSTDGTSQLWDNPAKALWASIRQDIPENWRVSGESLYAQRSVAYSDLPGWFVVFGVWDGSKALSWQEVTQWAELLGLPLAPVLYQGSDFKAATSAWSKDHDEETSEGYVVRNAGSFNREDFSKNVAKWVRADHVRTSASWRQRDDFKRNTISS